ncbi:MAG: DUF3006 domain-containing protein [Clostridia bacterium]
MKAIVDRFEGDFAIIELDDGQIQQIARSLLPPCAREGDVLDIVDGFFHSDRCETEKRKEEIEKLMQDVWKEEK